MVSLLLNLVFLPDPLGSLSRFDSSLLSDCTPIQARAGPTKTLRTPKTIPAQLHHRSRPSPPLAVVDRPSFARLERSELAKDG